MGKNWSKNLSKNLSNKYTQKLLHHAKEPATDALKTTSKRIIQQKQLVLWLIDNEITDEITKIPKNLQQNNSEAVTNEHNKEI